MPLIIETMHLWQPLLLNLCIQFLQNLFVNCEAKLICTSIYVPMLFQKRAPQSRCLVCGCIFKNLAINILIVMMAHLYMAIMDLYFSCHNVHVHNSMA